MSTHTEQLQSFLETHQDEFKQIRQDFHQHPELSFQEVRTSGIVADYLRKYGYTVETGIAKTGVIATLKRGNSPKVIGIRADMDALPITEETNLSYKSQTKAVMHACGHDGHTTIALAAARALSEVADFDGTVRFIFQPAEEIGSGAKKMIEEGLFTQYPVDAIYGLHNWPGLEAGKLAFINGPAMASLDFKQIVIRGKGSHGAEPHNGTDPIVVAAHLITAIQSIVARNIDPQEMGVITIGAINGGNAANVIPDTVEIKLTMRAYQENVRRTMLRRLEKLIDTITDSFDATATLIDSAGFSAVVNTSNETDFARHVAINALGDSAVDPTFLPRTASEDFSFFLEKKKGSFLFIGNGDSATLHNPQYNFNDDIIIPAARYWVELVTAYLAKEP